MDTVYKSLEDYDEKENNTNGTGGDGEIGNQPIVPIINEPVIPNTEPVIPEPVVNDEVLNYFKENGITHATREELKPYFDKAKNFDAETEKYNLSSTELAALKVREAELTEKIGFLKDFADPLKFFNSEDEYKASLLRKQRPDLDAQALTQVITKDFKTLSPLDTIRLQMKLTDSDVYPTDSVINETIAEKYGIDLETDFADLDSLTQSKIKKDVKAAQKEFESLKAEVKIPESVNVDEFLSKKRVDTTESIEKATQAWTPLVNQIPQQLDKYTITEDGKTVFEYAIGDDFRKSATENIGDTIQYLVSQGMEPNAENLQKTVENLKEYFYSQNKVKIMKAYATEQVTQAVIDLKKEYNNPTGANHSQANNITSKQMTTAAEQAEVLANLRGY